MACGSYPNLRGDLLMIKLINADCLPAMKAMPDKAFDLAIVDPPYGIGAHHEQGLGDSRNGNRTTSKWIGGKWDTHIPSDRYFKELFRVSENQIIWGGNYFNLPPTQCILAWDKVQRIDQSDFELAWTSFTKATRIFTFSRSNLQGFRNPNRFHPTEKPIDLYAWLLKNYAKPGDKILDTHGGSMSIAIACHDLGFDLTLYEIDKDYFSDGKARVERHMAQSSLFMQPTELIVEAM